MNICFVESGYPTGKSGGGAGTYVQLTAKELCRGGHEIFVITKHIEGELQEYSDDGVVVKRVKSSNWYWYFTKIPFVGKIVVRLAGIIVRSLAINAAIKQLNKKYRIDLVEFPETANFLYRLQVKIPYIVHLHGSSYTFKKYCHEKITPEDAMQRFLEGAVMRGAVKITSPSAFLKKEVMYEFGFPEFKINCIPYPIDECLLLASGVASRRQKRVFYAGRLEKRKGVHILKEAIVEVIRSYPNVVFELFGADTAEISGEELRRFFKQQNIGDKVHIYTFTPRQELFEHLRQADIAVVPSLWDNSPNTVYEAMIAGKVVIASKIGGIPDLIENEVNGILVEPNNAEALSQEILSVLVDEKKCQRIGAAARKKAIEQFNLQAVVKRRINVYLQVLKKDKNSNIAHRETSNRK